MSWRIVTITYCSKLTYSVVKADLLILCNVDAGSSKPCSAMWWYLQAGRISLVTIGQDMIIMHTGATAVGQQGGDADTLLLMPHGEHNCC